MPVTKKKKKVTKRKKAVAATRRTWSDKKKQEVGKRIAAARENAGFTIAELANKMGVFAPQIYSLESGKVLPSIPTLAVLCNQFNCSADSLIFGAVAKKKKRKL